MTNIFLRAASSIKQSIRDWNLGFIVYHPGFLEKRNGLLFVLKDLCASIVSLFLVPAFASKSNLYIFHRPRTPHLLPLFNCSHILILGSAEDLKLSRRLGCSFFSDYFIRSAVVSSVYRSWDVFLLWQLFFWRRRLARFNRVLIFLYEDTQPVGTFLAHLPSLLPGNAKAICLQHGYFNPRQPMRYEGLLCEYNFVWDQFQATLIGAVPEKTFVIGLPYSAIAHAKDNLSIILVGTGDPYFPRYRETLLTYSRIYNYLIKSLGLPVLYRPHPSEYANPACTSVLRSTFESLDSLGTEDRLANTQSVFIGNVSSLLYAARCTGHFVASFSLNDYWHTPDNVYDLQIDLRNLRQLADWILSLTPSKRFRRIQSAFTTADPAERFRHVLCETNLVKSSDLLC